MKEILDILIRDIDCFDATEKDFEDLKNIDVDDLEKLNQKAINVTPLLSQICSYSMADILSDDYMAKFLCDVNNAKEKLKALRVMKLCSAYVDELCNNNCKHPALTAHNDIILGVELYNTIMNLVSEVPCYLDETTGKLFKNFLDAVDKEIAKTVDKNCADTVRGVDKAQDAKIILNLMTKFAKLRGSILSLLNTSFSTATTDGINFIKTTKDGSKYSVMLSEMIGIINSMNINLHDEYYLSDSGYDLESKDEKNENAIESVKNKEEANRILCRNFLDILGAYESYKNNQFSYLKSRSEELKILDQCNKGVK